MLIYKATNKTNGKAYIGQTVGNLKQRKAKHIYNAQHKRNKCYFHKAIRKYGSENFDWEILQECDTIEELNKLEIHYIELYDTFNNGYNLTKGGEGSAGFKHSEDSLKKISEAAKKRPPISDITRKKLSETRKGKKHSEKSKRKMSKLALGRTPSEETRKKLSKIAKNRVFSKETRKKISKAHKNKVVSEETKQKMSRAAKKCWAKRNLLSISENC